MYYIREYGKTKPPVTMIFIIFRGKVLKSEVDEGYKVLVNWQTHV